MFNCEHSRFCTVIKVFWQRRPELDHKNESSHYLGIPVLLMLYDDCTERYSRRLTITRIRTRQVHERHVLGSIVKLESSIRPVKEVLLNYDRKC